MEEIKIAPPSGNDLKYYFEANKARYLQGADSSATFEKLAPRVQADWAREKQGAEYQKYVERLLQTAKVQFFTVNTGSAAPQMSRGLRNLARWGCSPPAPAWRLRQAIPPKRAVAASLDILSQVDRSEITIGDRIQYEIKVVYPKDGRVELPSVLGNLGSFEVKDYQATEPKDAGGLLIQTWHFDLSTYTVGKYTIPPQLVAYRHGTDTAAATSTPSPSKSTSSAPRRKPSRISRTSPPWPNSNPERPGWPMGWARRLWRCWPSCSWTLPPQSPRPRRPSPPCRPFEEAMAKLAGLKDLALIRQNRAREFCFSLSETLRRFLDRRFGTDSLESTTAEFLEKSRTLPVTQAQKQWLAEFCETTDLVKFANAPCCESDAGALDRQAGGIPRARPGQRIMKAVCRGRELPRTPLPRLKSPRPRNPPRRRRAKPPAKEASRSETSRPGARLYPGRAWE